MDFEFFLKHLSKIEKKNLKGQKAQYEMAPEFRERLPKNYATTKTRLAAVLALIYPKNGQAHLALIKRAVYNGSHSGQVAFPGGKKEDADINLYATALRETEEEIGVSETKITYLRDLTSIYIPPSDFRVHPFLAYSNKGLKFKLEEKEVSQMIEFPIAELLDDSNITQYYLQTKEAFLEAPAIGYQGFKIWGATAMMLNEVKHLLIESMDL